MSRHECFMVLPTHRVGLTLRRYCLDPEAKCSSPFGYHNAEAPFGEMDIVLTENGVIPVFPEDKTPPRDDPRWPSTCVCGSPFADTALWQVMQELLYHRPESAETFTLRDAPIGAMWHCDWYPEEYWREGVCLAVMTPGGAWVPDMPSDQGRPWSRTGTPPLVSYTPSILLPNKYHGFLTNGFLESTPDSPT